MAIIPGTFRTIIPTRDGADSDDKGRITAELTVRFQFQDDDPTTTSIDVYNYPGMPARGEAYYYDCKFRPQFICQGVHATRISSGASYWWELEVRYKRLGVPEDGDEYDEMNFSVSSGTIIIPTVAKYDYFGRQIQNSASQQFDPPAQYDRRIATFTFTRDEYRNPIYKRLRFEGAVNSVPMWGLPRHTIKVNEIKVSKSVVLSDDPEKRVNYKWSVSYELAIDISMHGYNVDDREIYGWQTAVLDCGKMAYEDFEEPASDESEEVEGPEESEGKKNKKLVRKLVRIRDANGLEVDEPQRLDGKGKVLESNKKDVYLRFMLHHLEDLNFLNLPNPFMV